MAESVNVQHDKPSKKRSRTISVIHRTVRSPSKTQHAIDKKPVASEKILNSISTIPSTRQHGHKQKSLEIQSYGQRQNATTNWNSKLKQNDDFTSTLRFNQQSPISNYSTEANKFQPKWRGISLESKESTNGHPTILDGKKKQKKRSKFCCSFSIPCALLSLLICFLLAAAIAAIIVSVMIVPKATTTTIPTTLTTTTPITSICSCLCANEMWTFSSGLLARWSFDGTFNDVMNTYNATPLQNPTFVSNGYVNQALFFNAAALQSLSTSYIPLAYISFTVEAWLKPTAFPNLIDHSILGLCPSASAHLCLHLVIRKIVSNYYLYFGLFADDCQGNTSLTLNQWIHVAFVFDITTLTQSIYLNGLLDNICTASAPLMANVGSVTIGVVPAIIPINNVNFFQGYIDHVSITNRAKSSCEVLEDATLAACFTFDAVAPYTDSGPNSLLNNKMSTDIISSGHSLEAISFNGSSTSYFQALSFTGLGLINQPFSIMLWIRPRSVVSATLVHVSATILGTGWCVPFVGITGNSSLIAQVFNAGSAVISGPSIPTSPVWSHVVETWSQTNGLRLYVNGILVASNTLFTGYTASGVSDVVTLANSLSGYNYCAGFGPGPLAPGPFDGDIDDFRLYSRQLTAAEVQTIYAS